MQSEIDEIRSALEVLHVMNDCGLLTEARTREGLNHIGRQLDLVEAQQAVNADVALVPVTTLASITAGAIRDKRARMTVIQGGAA